MKFLKNFFGNKKEKVEEKTKVVLSMPLFKGEETYDLNTLIEDLKNYWGLDVCEVDEDENTSTFQINGDLVALASMPSPIPASEFDDLYAYSYLWNNVENEAREHTSHAIVSILSKTLSPVEQYSLLTKVNASILRTCENAIGIYQGSATLLLPKNLYFDFSDFLKEDNLPLQLWLYIGIINQEDKSSVYTYGMKEFGKSEIEIIDSAMDSDDLYYFLLSILQYILEGDVILNDGETIGFSEEQKIKITESKAVYLDGNSLKLEV